MDVLPLATVKSTSKSDIIIVGAGLSGLTSAVKLMDKEPSFNVKILEGTTQIGGQIRSSRLGEIGGKWLTPDQFHIYKLLKTFKKPLGRRVVTEPQLKRCWDIDCGLLSILVNNEIDRYIQELDLSGQYFQQGKSNRYQSTGSMRRHIDSRLFFGMSRKFMANVVLLISGMDARDIAYNDFMSLCCSNGGLLMLLDLYLYCPESLLEISSSNLLKEYQDRIHNVEILFKRKVIEIRHYRDFVEVKDSEQEVHQADVVILAIPWNKIESIQMTPAIPFELRKPPVPMDRGKHMATSFLAKYLGGHWRTAGYSGNLLLNKPYFMIGHEYRSSIYSGLIIHDEGADELMRSHVLHSLADQFGEEMLRPIEYYQWTYEMSPMAGLPFTTPWNRIVWSSSASAASCYRGRLGGAVQSGLRAAMNALLILRPQTVHWQDIAEIQCSTILVTPKPTRLQIWLSSWNLSNFSYYSLFLLGTAAVLRFLFNNGYL